MKGLEEEIEILLAEDNDDIGELLQLLLEQKGLNVTRVKDGVSALEALKQSVFHLLLSDIRMPRMDGITLISEVKQLAASKMLTTPLPTIAMSNGGEEILSSARQAGAAFTFDKTKLFEKLPKLITKIKELVQEQVILREWQSAH